VSETRFFCENCGAEVPRDEEKCPECGRVFASVRCPACSFVGQVAQFKDGCPVCGYSAAGPSANPISKAKAKTKRKKKPPKNQYPAASLPFWVYVLTGAIFTAIMAALFFKIAK